jgi:hypothetical protein
MYKVVIDIGDWTWAEDETVTIETADFEKAQIIQEFIEFQKDHGWAADYDVVEYEDEEEEDEEVEEDEEDKEAEYSVGDMVEDEDGFTWIFLG